ncbi:MAG: hypothetical protein E7604_06610 [Ruminococcaceae bacterium]|nr:hypothetical protein [Oscillospiraceae bacterium]
MKLSTKGSGEIEGLPIGQYTVRVSKAPDDYAIPDDIAFTLGADSIVETAWQQGEYRGNL